MNEPDIRYEKAREAFQSIGSHWLSLEPLQRWVLPTDRHLPGALLGLSLSELLAMPYSAVQRTKGVGETKLEKLVVLVERAICELQNVGGSRFNTTGADDLIVNRDRLVNSKAVDSIACLARRDDIALSDLSDEQWQHVCNCLKKHNLDSFPLGRFADSLYELPRGLWECPLAQFINAELVDLREIKGYGDLRISVALKIVVSIASYLSPLPETDTHCVYVLPARLCKVQNWINRILSATVLPSYQEFSDNFLLPLVEQLEVDLGEQTAEMIKLRLGVNNTAMKLQEIAERYGLTRERIRQLTIRAVDVFQVRWPEGRHVLDDFYERFLSLHNSESYSDTISRTLELLFDVDTSNFVSKTSVLIAWENAGKHKETPMSENEILQWLGTNFPTLSPALGSIWIRSQSLSVEYHGRRLYFSNDTTDQILYRLYSSRRATHISELVIENDDEERNLRMKLQRDLRFTEDTDHCYLPTEYCGFIRDSVAWYANLVPFDTTLLPTRTFLAIETIVASAIGGLVARGIFDTTVWGFHRYVNEQLRFLYKAELPDTINPFTLSDMVVRHSNRQIRAMRRRRLRWDSEMFSQQNAKGKLGWVSFVVSEANMPIVLDELGNLLSKYYQDYDSYVIEQLDLDPDEEGSSELGVVMHRKVPHKLPTILVPESWQLDSIADNVSEGVKLAVTRSVNLLKEGRLSLKELEHIDWFVALIKRLSYGTEFSKEMSNSSKDITKTYGGIERISRQELDVASEQIASTDAGKHQLHELLQRFL